MDDDFVAVAVDHLQHMAVHVEREALGPAREQHFLAGLEPELLVGGDALVGEVGENIVIVDDAILKNLDEAGALVGMRGLEHIDQILVNVDAPGNEPCARTKCEGAGVGRPVDRAERSRGRSRPDP